MHDDFEPASFGDPVIADLVRGMRRRGPASGLSSVELPVVWEARGDELRRADGRHVTARLATDRGGDAFAVRAELELPGFANLESGGKAGPATHLLVNVNAPFFSEHRAWEHEVELVRDGDVLDARVFAKWYVQHQFLISLAEIEPGSRLELRARPTAVGTPVADVPLFTVSLYVISKPKMFESLERSAIWLFSSARAGSTWLASDILCANDQARPIDESGIGRMFAPLRWDPERFYGLEERAAEYVESGFAFETGARIRRSTALPPFERAFSNMRLENQILSRRTERVFLRMLRETALEHVVSEWGLRDYRRVVFKSPNEAHGADFIMRAFPRSRMVFLQRDGRDVIRSRFSAFGSEELNETKHRGLRLHAIAFYAHWWNFQTDIVASAYDAHDPALRSFIRYEDLRSEPQRVLVELFDRLELPATEAEIAELIAATAIERYADRGANRPRQQGRVGGFRESFNAEEIALMNAIMGPNLEKYGYSLE